MVVSEIDLFEALSKQLGADKARTLVKYVETKVEKKVEEKKDVFLTKEDKIELLEKISETKVDILRTVYAVGIVQLIAIIGSILAIINFVQR